MKWLTTILILTIILIAGCTETKENSLTEKCYNFCSGSVLNYNGAYIEGECRYSKINCNYGCSSEGCEQPRWVGLEITDFQSDQTEIFGGRMNRIIMVVNNKGGYKVPQNKALIYLTGSAVSTEEDNKTYWTMTDGQFRTFEKDMNPYDPVRDLPSDEKALTWFLSAPIIKSGITRTDLLIGRIFYEYSTILAGTFWVYSENEADREVSAGNLLKMSSWAITEGPVVIEVKIIKDPIVSLNSENSFSFSIKISNAGGGVPYKSGSVNYVENNATLKAEDFNRINIAVDSPGMTISGCTGDKELPGGKNLELTCDAEIESPPKTFQSYPIKITASYGYFTERSMSIIVKGV